jgi:hypothetical protein
MSTRLRFTSLVVLALLGTWLGHGVEYGLVAGLHGVVLGLTGPLHSYMLPAALFLSLGTFALALRVAAVARATRQRADRLWRLLRRGVRHEPAQIAPTVGCEPHPFGLVAVLALAQTALYLAQENVEAAVQGAPAPGLGAVTGAHWTAPIVQLAFATWLALGWLVCTRILRRRHRAIARLEAVLHALARRRRLGTTGRVAVGFTLPRSWSSAPHAARAPPEFAVA